MGIFIKMPQVYELNIAKKRDVAPAEGSTSLFLEFVCQLKPLSGFSELSNRLDVDETSAVFTFSEDNSTVYESVDSVVFTHTHVQTGVVNSASLTFDNVACLSELTTENFNTESFAFRLAAVLRTTYTFLMCHFLRSFLGLSNYIFNNNFGEALTVTVFATIAFAAFFLENDNLVTFHEGSFHFANNFSTINGGLADFHGTVGVDEEHAVKFHGSALFGFFAEIVNIQELSGFSLELLSLNFYNSVHLKK